VLSKQDIYLRLPRRAQQLAVLSESLKNRVVRYGAAYRRMLELVRSTERWSPEQLRALQVERLRRLLDEARRGTVYYADVLADRSDADLEAIVAGLRIEELPLLPKKTLKERTPEMFNRLRRRFSTSATSGSTGSPLIVEYDRESIQERMAVVHRQREWFGAPPLARGVRLSGREIVSQSRRVPPYWIDNPFESQLLVSTYHLRDDALEAIADRIREFDPQVIDGYPTAIVQVARRFAGRPRLSGLRGVVTTAETLTPDLREEIERGLGVRVFDYYAASEGVPLIQQCEQGGYHLRPETGIFEILDPQGRPVAPGEIGELVATGFCQWKTPLIRYQTGDFARRAATEERCACGRTLPLVGEIVGRLEDLVLTPDGRQIGMFSYRTIKYVPGIREAQIVQKTPTHFLVRWVPDATRSPEDVRGDVGHIFARVLGYQPEVTYEEVVEIARGRTGKFRSTIREFKGAPS
jgi:phenylacetate-CoA ligase